MNTNPLICSHDKCNKPGHSHIFYNIHSRERHDKMPHFSCPKNCKTCLKYAPTGISRTITSRRSIKNKQTISKSKTFYKKSKTSKKNLFHLPVIIN